jgi:hypothetical protein
MAIETIRLDKRRHPLGKELLGCRSVFLRLILLIRP